MRLGTLKGPQPSDSFEASARVEGHYGLQFVTTKLSEKHSNVGESVTRKAMSGTVGKWLRTFQCT